MNKKRKKRKLISKLELNKVLIKTHLNLLLLITNDEDSIRRVDSDNLDGKQDLLVDGASFVDRPSYNSLDQDNHQMDPDVYKLEKNINLLIQKSLKVCCYCYHSKKMSSNTLQSNTPLTA